MKNLFFLLTLSFAAVPSMAKNNPDDVLGVWQNGSGKGQVQIYKQNGRYYGKICWIKDTKDAGGELKVDKNNPDETLRQRPLLGIQMMRDFTYDDGEWNGGKLYNPKDGKEYQCILKLTDTNTLKVRGYIGFSFVGKTDIWSRIR